ncbi:hypothetical protein GY03_17935 [Proteus vulgaris]|nr:MULTISPECIES: hypothetical protein [unclassified Shigella]MCT6519160.1 hypothetical protein [Proteus vulgaris]
MKTPTGNFELATLCDRNGFFEPQLVKKHQTTLSNEIEHKITHLFAYPFKADYLLFDLLVFFIKTAFKPMSSRSVATPLCF